jgi:hypothetical protein
MRPKNRPGKGKNMNRILFRYQPGLPVTVRITGNALEVDVNHQRYGAVDLEDSFPLEMVGPWEGLFQVVHQGAYLSAEQVQTRKLADWLSDPEQRLRLVLQHDSTLRPVEEFSHWQGRLELRGSPGLKAPESDWRWQAALHLPCHIHRIYTQGQDGSWRFSEQPGSLSVQDAQEHLTPPPDVQDHYRRLASLIPTKPVGTAWGLPQETVRMTSQGMDWFRINPDSSQTKPHLKGV